MQLTQQTKNFLRNVARGWKASVGCLPCEIVIRDCGFLHVSRPCVFVTFAGRGQHGITEEVFLSELYTMAQARRFAGLCKSSMHQSYDAAPARITKGT